MVRKISGKSKAASHQHLNTNFNGGAETKATTKKDIADTLGEAFSTTSANRNYSKEFQNYQIQQKRSSSIISPIIMKNIIIPLI